MKKNFLNLLLAGALVVGVSSCGGDDESGPTGPNDTEFVYDTITFEEEVGGEDVDVNMIQVTIKDDGKGTGTMTLTNDKVWVLDGFVFVNEGQTLTIEEGTIIKGKSGQGANASALIVARGAMIDAEGTASMPIIMTSAADKTYRSEDGTLYAENNLNQDSKGLWGGLIVLGNAGLNSAGNESAVEGIPTSETRALYGGDNDADNSGTIKYVSVRHGGSNIGAGNEINGITLGGVGSETTIEYVEVFANDDDGIEFFGGTAAVKYAVVGYCGDDGFDYDEGWRGKGQFWAQIQDGSDRGGEHDGGTSPEDGTPYATPMIYNATYVGDGDGRAITFRDNAGGEYHNSIFYNFSNGIDVEDLAEGEDSYNRLVAGDLKLAGILFDNVSGNYVVSSNGDDLSGESFVMDINIAANTGISSTDLKPTSNDNGTAPTDSWFTSVTYKGAFDANATSNWMSGWTALDENGLIDDNVDVISVQ